MTESSVGSSVSGGDAADVLIIGAGVSGSVAAMHLAEAGFTVVCLEQGDYTNPQDFPGAKLEYELLIQKQWHPNPNVRQHAADYPCETSESDVNPLMYNAVGGSAILYGAAWPRFAPSDFRVRSLDGIADDWPFTYEDLEPYYEQIEREIGVSGLGGDPAYPPGAPFPMPPFPLGLTGMAAARGMDKMGWHWWPGPQAIASRPYGNLRQCVRRGTCLTGCPDRAKATPDLTHWPRALAHGARLVTGARVREIEVDENGLATSAIYVDRAGTERRQKARIIILAANGVGTPRLLLLSTSKRFPDGLANSSGLIGKRLMMHPFGDVIGIFEENLESWLGPVGLSVQSMQFYETDETRGFVRGAKWQVMPTGGPLGKRAGYEGAPDEESWGVNIHRNVRKVFGHSIEWGIIAEDLPDESNRVTLDPTLTDADGIPAPKIIYRQSENTRRLLDFHIARVKESLDAAGASEIIVSPLMRDCGWHLMGTTRMGNDPATSVVDAFCRTHDVPNLYIIDGSVFVTSSGVNPTPTLAAVALRCVKNLIVQRRAQEVPA